VIWSREDVGLGFLRGACGENWGENWEGRGGDM